MDDVSANVRDSAELEALRESVAGVNSRYEPFYSARDMEYVFDALDTERAAVVAFLRLHASASRSLAQGHLEDAADRIERGEHRR